MNRAQELFLRIKQNNEITINELIDNAEVEQYFLEFKTLKTKPDSRGLENSDRENFAKAISGFGNSEGGILIWGIDYPSRGDTKPQACPINNPNSFADRLNNLITACTLPVHRTVENYIIYTNHEKTIGYVVSYIPKSNDMPHQCLQGKQYFYIRAGSSFEQAPYGMLSRMFGVTPTPSLELSLETLKSVKQDAKSNQPSFISVNVIIKNTGFNSAHELFVTAEYISVPSNITLKPSSGDQNINLFKNSSGAGCFSITKSDYKLPPKGRHQMLHLQININNNTDNKELNIIFWIGAYGCSPKYHELSISQEQLKNLLEKSSTIPTLGQYLKSVP